MAKTDRLSTGFGGASTKGFDSIDREVESRMKRARMDVFTDDFTPPGSFDAFNGGDYSKPGFIADPHSDYSSDDDNSQNHNPNLKPMSLDDKIDKKLANIESYKGRKIWAYRKMKDFYPMIDGNMIQKEFPSEPEAISHGKRLVDQAEAKRPSGRWNHMEAGSGPNVNDKSQEELDAIDEVENLFNEPTKHKGNDFPGVKMSKKLSIESIHDHIEEKLAHMDDQSGGIHIDIDSHKGEHEMGEESGAISVTDEADKLPADAAANFDEHAVDPAKLSFDEKVEKKMAKAAKPHVDVRVEKSDEGFELVILVNGAKAYGEDGFESEKEARDFAKTYIDKKGLEK